MTSNIPQIKLRNQIHIPQLGLGLYLVPPHDMNTLIREAVDLGYRSFDTATYYQNEEALGEVISELIQEEKISSEEIFITTKVWNTEQGYKQTVESLERSLKRLRRSYIDLYLIHWPVPTLYKETWEALVSLYNQHLIRAIGVSNFHQSHLKSIMEYSSHYPLVNQVECHPFLNQNALQTFCQENKIAFTAWGPLGHKGLLSHPQLDNLAKKYQKTIAQIILRWHIQSQRICIPKTVHLDRLKENINIFDFKLSQSEINHINALNKDQRFGPDPDNFNF